MTDWLHHILVMISILFTSMILSIFTLVFWDLTSCCIFQATKKKSKYEEEDEFDESEDAESDITESDFEDPDEMEVQLQLWYT